MAIVEAELKQIALNIRDFLEFVWILSWLIAAEIADSHVESA